MALKEEFEQTGNWLFQWRSYIPLSLMGIILIGIWDAPHTGFSHTLNQIWDITCLLIALFGLGIRVYTTGHVPKYSSGRDTKCQKAKTLNTTGIYSIVRHPLYFGNLFCWLGISMLVQVWWVCLIFIFFFWLYYERIMFAEEEFLRKKFGGEYEEWADKTPAFLPKFRNWIPPALSFSFKTVLRREYSGLFAIIASFTFIVFIRETMSVGNPKIDLPWLILFSGGFLIYLFLRILKKRSRILYVKGR